MTVTTQRETAPERVERRIVVAADGSIVAYSGKVEYGQGIRTGFARIVAEELRVPIERVRVELGETDTAPWDMGTFGSMSTAVDGASLRRAAAFARTLMLERAAERLGVRSAQLEFEDGVVRAADGRAVTFAELAHDRPLTGEIPESVPATAARGAAAPAADVVLRLEGLEIVTGRRCYPADIRLPGMLRGHVLHGPALGAKLISLDERPALTMPGVVSIVHDRDFAGVVARRDEQARAAVDAMHATWAVENVAAAPLELTLRNDKGVDRALAGAARTLEASYHVPHVAHAALCPSTAVADVRDDGVHLYVATQRPFGLKDEAAHALGVSPEAVHVHPQAMGGMFGRGGVNDAPLEAALLSRAVRRPVLVQWTRPEEFRLSPARPTLDATILAGLDATGRIIGWRSSSTTNPFTYGAAAGSTRVLELTSGRNAVPAYEIDNVHVLLRVEPGAIRTGAFRSLAAAPNIFAIESFVDELAVLCGQDPIAFRLRHIGDPRLARVLEIVRERSRWGDRTRDGRALGVACAIYHGTYVAQVVHVRMQSQGAVRLERAWCAVDAGRLVHPDGARNQIEGGIQHAASCALLERLQIADGAVRTATWRDYSIATFFDAPAEIDVSFVSDRAEASSGIGEPGFVPTAAALANAIYAATNGRLRRLPLDGRG
jgi:CO/xanthine dehydrogenase Mo-binding subunit